VAPRTGAAGYGEPVGLGDGVRAKLVAPMNARVEEKATKREYMNGDSARFSPAVNLEPGFG
jgi:hypothetical protein